MKLLNLLLECPAGALLDLIKADIGFAVDEKLHEASPCGTEKIRYDGIDFDVGTLKGFMDASPEITDRSHITLTGCPKLTPLAGVPWQDEASFEQAVSKEPRQPLGVCDVRLAPGNILDMTGVDQDDLEMLFKHVVDWTPVNARTLDCGNGAVTGNKPVPESVEVVGVGPKFSDFTECMSVFVGSEKTSRNTVFVNVESAACGVDNGKNLAILSLGHGCSPDSLWGFQGNLCQWWTIRR
jgi:hypothetical protein